MTAQAALFDMPVPQRLTEAHRRDLERQLRDLRRQWRSWMSGAMFVQMGWWGLPWCSHRIPQPPCEGCATRMWCRDRAAELGPAAAAITAQLEVLPST
ncbi:MAG TPA: hypothetical protein VF062_23405 [Candidatus Limnocylindrales bacterium]